MAIDLRIGIGIALAAAINLSPAASAQDDVPASALSKRAMTTVADALQALDAPPVTPRSRSRSMAAVPASDPAVWFDPDRYPKEAIRANRQGRVVVVLGIDAAGTVTSCTVRTSSGTTILDERTCALARERGRFDPATDEKGHPIAGTYVMPVRWTLPDTPRPTVDAADVPPHLTYAVEVSISAEGTITGCTIIEATGLQQGADPCAGYPIGKRAGIVSRDGRPVPYRVVQHLAQDTVLGE